jgi:hypothetical protein
VRKKERYAPCQIIYRRCPLRIVDHYDRLKTRPESQFIRISSVRIRESQNPYNIEAPATVRRVGDELQVPDNRLYRYNIIISAPSMLDISLAL